MLCNIGCSIFEPNSYPSQQGLNNLPLYYHAVKIGMPRPQVIQLLGEPPLQRIDSSPKTLVYIHQKYDQGKLQQQRLTIHFNKNNTVSRYNLSPLQTASSPKE